MLRNWTRVYAYSFHKGPTIYWTIINTRRIPLMPDPHAPWVFHAPTQPEDGMLFAAQLQCILDEHDWAHEDEADHLAALVTYDPHHEHWFPGWEHIVFNDERNPDKLIGALVHYTGGYEH